MPTAFQGPNLLTYRDSMTQNELESWNITKSQGFSFSKWPEELLAGARENREWEPLLLARMRISPWAQLKRILCSFDTIYPASMKMDSILWQFSMTATALSRWQVMSPLIDVISILTLPFLSLRVKTHVKMCSCNTKQQFKWLRISSQRIQIDSHSSTLLLLQGWKLWGALKKPIRGKCWYKKNKFIVIKCFGYYSYYMGDC